MTLENIKTSTAGIADTVVDDSTKLLPAVVTLVQNMPGGVDGLVKLFQEKGLGNVAAALTGKTTHRILPEQLVQGLGSNRITSLASASGLDARVVRVKLVEVLPKVLLQLTPADKTVEPA